MDHCSLTGVENRYSSRTLGFTMIVFAFVFCFFVCFLLGFCFVFFGGGDGWSMVRVAQLVSFLCVFLYITSICSMCPDTRILVALLVSSNCSCLCL
jgi:hypothetical protein